MIKGLLNVNKPKGFTSQDVVSVVRGILSTREIGHMGTLDPQGEGVLLLGVGKGTRLFDLMLKKDKVYRAEFDFGYETDTLDADGRVEKTTTVIPSKEDILKVLSSFLGEIDQVPPKYSAKKINGRKAYDIARSGKDFELKSCKVTVYDIKILERTGENKYMFEVHCSAGTYIRSLCRDIAYALGSLATMTSILRTRCGKFLIEDSISLDELETVGAQAVLPLGFVLDDIRRYDVEDSYYDKLCNGVAYPVCIEMEQPFAVFCKNELFGLGEIKDGLLKIKTYLRD